jgi:hypothetical protein
VSLRPNPAGAVDAPIASLFILLRLGRRATDQRRWAKLTAERGVHHQTMNNLALPELAASPGQDNANLVFK